MVHTGILTHAETGVHRHTHTHSYKFTHSSYTTQTERVLHFGRGRYPITIVLYAHVQQVHIPKQAMYTAAREPVLTFWQSFV